MSALDYEARGRRLLDQYIQALQNPNHTDVVAESYHVKYHEERTYSALLNCDAKTYELLAAKGVNSRLLEYVEMTSKPADIHDMTESWLDSNMCFSNGFCESTILCSFRDKTYDRADPRLEMSELLFQAYMATLSPDQEPKFLHWFWCVSVTNDTTRNMAKVCHYLASGRTCYIPTDPEFYIMLGTPNLGTLLHMLRDHGHALGRKMIKSVEIYPEDEGEYDLAVCVELTDCDAIPTPVDV